ncbi:MAG: hypothetical protein J6B96_07475 [Agathobacter sp.]|nr:hypothetical protein [Agathobacter sp.]
MKKMKSVKKVFLGIGIQLLGAISIFLIANTIPIEKKYHLEDVEDNQAVMLVEYAAGRTFKTALVTKSGRWKCVDRTDIWQANFALPVKDRRSFMEIIDEVMEDETIPYQETKLKLSKNLLNKAINLPGFRFSYVEKTDMYETCTEAACCYYAIVGTGDDRRPQLIGKIGQEPFVRMNATKLRFDIDIILMIQKLDRLEAMRKEVME